MQKCRKILAFIENYLPILNLFSLYQQLQLDFHLCFGKFVFLKIKIHLSDVNAILIKLYAI